MGRGLLASSARRRHRLPPLFPPPVSLHKKTSNHSDQSGRETAAQQKWQQTEAARPRRTCTHQIWTFLRITGVRSRRDTPASPLSTTGRSCRSGWTWRSGSTRVWTNSTPVRWVQQRRNDSFEPNGQYHWGIRTFVSGTKLKNFDKFLTQTCGVFVRWSNGSRPEVYKSSSPYMDKSVSSCRCWICCPPSPHLSFYLCLSYTRTDARTPPFRDSIHTCSISTIFIEI